MLPCGVDAAKVKPRWSICEGDKLAGCVIRARESQNVSLRWFTIVEELVCMLLVVAKNYTQLHIAKFSKIAWQSVDKKLEIGTCSTIFALTRSILAAEPNFKKWLTNFGRIFSFLIPECDFKVQFASCFT